MKIRLFIFTFIFGLTAIWTTVHEKWKLLYFPTLDAVIPPYNIFFFRECGRVFVLHLYSYFTLFKGKMAFFILMFDDFSLWSEICIFVAWIKNVYPQYILRSSSSGDSHQSPCEPCFIAGSRRGLIIYTYICILYIYIYKVYVVISMCICIRSILLAKFLWVLLTPLVAASPVFSDCYGLGSSKFLLLNFLLSSLTSFWPGANITVAKRPASYSDLVFLTRSSIYLSLSALTFDGSSGSGNNT